MSAGVLEAGASGTVAVGFGTLDNLTSGASNTAIGYQSAQTLTTGASNVSIGYQAMGNSNNASQKNVIIGKSAFYNGQVDEAVFIGFNAGGDATTETGANGAVGIGKSVLNNLTSAQRMTAIGYQALLSEDAGSYQTAVGYQALSQVNNDNGHNTALGQRAGYNLTTGYSNTLIGSSANASGSGGINQTVIGASATGQADNSVTLGNSSVTKVYVGSGGSDQSIVFKDSAEQGKIRYDHNNEQFQIFVGGSEKIKFETGGDIRLLDGGINFPDDASSSASSDANTLDDYEEGTWTPVYSDGTNNATSYVSDQQQGSYTKIGNLVHIQVQIKPDNIGSVSGALRIEGLPFTSKNVGARPAFSVGFAEGMSITGSESIHGFVNQGGTHIVLRQFDSTSGDSSLTTTEFPVNGRLVGSATYLV
jgi:hypothetical protein